MFKRSKKDHVTLCRPPPPPRMSCFIWIALILAHDKIRMYVEKFSHFKNISGRIIWRYCIQGLNGLCCHCRHLRFHHLRPPGVNFINVKLANFTYECHFGSFFTSYLYVKKAAEMTFVRKMRMYNVDEIDGRSLFRKPFLHVIAQKAIPFFIFGLVKRSSFL